MVGISITENFGCYIIVRLMMCLDEKSYLEDEIKALEAAYKEVAVEKGKFHKLYLALKEGKESVM